MPIEYFKPTHAWSVSLNPMKYRMPDPAVKPKIYELDGDTFKLCYAAPGEERPKEFSAKGANGITLAVWKRAKK